MAEDLRKFGPIKFQLQPDGTIASTLPQPSAPKGIDLATLCGVVFETVTAPDVAAILEVPAGQEAKELLSKVLPGLTLELYQWNIEQTQVPISSTTPHPHESTASCKVHFCIADPVDLLEARVTHELTHAIRYLLTVAVDKPQTSTPEKQLGGDRYKLQNKKFHSGYLVEHRLFGGVRVLLTGFLKLPCEPYGRVLEPCEPWTVVSVKETSIPVSYLVNGFVQVEPSKCWEELTVFNKESGSTDVIHHCGRRVTKTEDDDDARVL